MKLLEIITLMDESKRIKRNIWIGIYLVRSISSNEPLIQIDMYSLQMGKYTFTYEDLIADDWEII